MADFSNRAIPLRALNEYAYCPRLFHLMYIEEIFIENEDTEQGQEAHRRAESRPRVRKPQTKSQDSQKSQDKTEASKDVQDAQETNIEKEVQLPVQLKFSDTKQELIGVLDAIQEEGNHYAPVESKKAAAPKAEARISWAGFELQPGLWYNDQLQVAGQIRLLRANGYVSDYAYVYYRGSKQRRKFIYTEEWDTILNTIIQKIRNHKSSPRPAPLKHSRKCVRCSLNIVCLPDETNFLTDADGTALKRKIIPARYDKSMIYVFGYAKKIGLASGNLRITDLRTASREDIPIRDILSLNLFGYPQISTQAIGSLLDAGIRISYLSPGGRLRGVAAPFSTKNSHLRKLQYTKLPEKSLDLSRLLIATKIYNQLVFLNRNSSLAQSLVEEMQGLSKKARHAREAASLLGYEGSAARTYFKNFHKCLKKEHVSFQFQQRNRRPPRDPVNAMLSFAYTLLVNDFTNIIYAVGLDPNFGFFHAQEKGRPALALDLMEVYRPVVADSAVVRAINTGMVQVKDFQETKAGVFMKKKARRQLIKSYEQRLNQMIRHPLFQYHLSYRRLFELEVRLLGRYLEGEIPEWKPLKIR